VNDRTLKDRYRLDRKLGEGGMATVYAGTDSLLRRRVAVKILRPQFAADVDFVRRFYHEAESVARLSYPNIVSIYDVGRDGDTYFIVMELVDGTTLAELIDADGRLPEAVVIDFAEQVCRALAYAHRQGIMHRDVKPANILITKDDVVKLSDFGIARVATTQTMTLTSPGMVMGSVYYLSPEQAQGHELRESSDLYSLGVVIYQMLTGKLPYTGDSPITVALKHVSSPVPEIASEGISPALAAIVERLLQKDPAARYQSATEVAAALREARDDALQPAGAPLERTQPMRRVVPPPPPRRAASPDRPFPQPPVMAQAREDERRARGRPSALTVIGLIGLFVVSALAGYYVTGRPGGLFAGPGTVTVPAVVGKDAPAAEQLLSAQGLRFSVTTAPSETAPRDRVIAQQPAGATLASSDAIVQLTVSSGLPTVDVVDLRSYSQEDAVRYLHDAKIAAKIVEVYDQKPRGTVLKQVPGPGRLPMKSVVTLTVSKGPSPVSVPSVVSMTLDDATTALRRAGLNVETDREPSDNIPENVVTSQTPDGGATADRGSPVTLVVSSGPAPVAVPDLTGRGVGDATAALQQAGLVVQINYSLQPGDPVGTVLAESPPAATQVKRGSPVTLTIVVSGIVPDVSGMTLDQARTGLQNAGYTVGNVAYTQSGVTGKVANTEPGAGTALRPGEAVTIYFNDGGGEPPSPSAAPSPAPAATR